MVTLEELAQVKYIKENEIWCSTCLSWVDYKDYSLLDEKCQECVKKEEI